MLKRGNEFVGSMVYDNNDEKVRIRIDLFKLNPESGENHDMWFNMILFNLDFEIKNFGGYIPKDGLELTNLKKYFEILNDEILYKADPEYVGFEYFDFSKLPLKLTAFKDVFKDTGNIEKAAYNLEFTAAGFNATFYVNDIGDEVKPGDFIEPLTGREIHYEDNDLEDDYVEEYDDNNDIISEQLSELDRWFEMTTDITLDGEDDDDDDF